MELHDLLVSNLFVKIRSKDNLPFARLSETGKDAKLKQVDIYGISNDALLIKLDHIELPRALFKGGVGERRRCDYLLITKMNGASFLIFIEMKSSKLNNNEITQQFKGAECLVDYFDSVMKRFQDENDFLSQHKKRFVVFYRPRIPKPRVRPAKRLQTNDCPENPLKYPAPHNPSLKDLIII